MADVLSTPRPRLLSRRALVLGLPGAVGGCVAVSAIPGPESEPPRLADGAFVMADGARLPCRIWLPDGPPKTVVLALHGFNDSRDAWEIPAPDFVAAGIALYAPDQRCFGAAPGRGYWPGTDALVDDAAQMCGLLHKLHPGVPVVLMGESMGGAVLMALATGPDAPKNVRYVLLAPAVWGRARMNLFLRSGLWLVANTLPGLAVSGAPVRVMASDNREALIQLSRSPLTIHRTRFDTLRGLVDLMDTALGAAPRFTAPAFFLYGGKDELVPPEATASTWHRLPPGAPVRLGYYPHGYHLLLRDLVRAYPIGDVIAWIRNPDAPLPSGADRAAALWLGAQT